MKALILSCNTGGGHNSAAKAIAEELISHGEEAYVLDYLCLAGKGISKLVGDGYVQIVKKTPLLFGLIYKLGILISRITRKSPVYYVNGRMAKYLRSYLKEHPADVLIMPHLYPAETITYMKRKGMDLPVTIAVMTDYTCIPFWEETDCDHYILPHEALRKSCIKKGIPNEKIQTFGIPVAKNCQLKISKAESRKKLGLEVNQKYFLIVGGSMGAGDFIELIQKLISSTDSEQILAICGNNRKAERKLKKKFKEESRVIVLGFTDQMPLYLRACDVVFTKPGGLTSTEAAVIRVPIIHTAPIPGCETINRRFFMRAGMSSSAITVKGQVSKGIRLMNDLNAQKKMVNRQAKEIHGDAAEQLYKFICLQCKSIQRNN
ncbi:MAG: MGDG synthase family glycosyltransferase [Marvinbryantia sp.]|jgi:processive 1,2-diacylglycerol beta-glucosyltransferase